MRTQRYYIDNADVLMARYEDKNMIKVEMQVKIKLEKENHENLLRDED